MTSRVTHAPGYTGRLITRYLASHPQSSSFTFAIAGRSKSKLDALFSDLSLPNRVSVVVVDIADFAQVEAVIQNTRVVINTCGPFWKLGTPIVRACVSHGVHYVDLTGETPWIRDIIFDFDFAATRKGVIIVPACGLDSVPSDISAFLSSRTLNELYDRPIDINKSVTALKLKGGISAGSLSTMFLHLSGEIPRIKLEGAAQSHSLSPVRGLPSPPNRFIYRLSLPSSRTIVGAYFPMKSANLPIVQRTWGLLEYEARWNLEGIPKPREVLAADKSRYGPSFKYDEFLETPSTFRAVLLTIGMVLGVGSIMLPPLRWILQKLLPSPGQGPSEEVLGNGWIQTTNLTTSVPSPAHPVPIQVQTVMKGRGDPGYFLTSIIISEAALLLLSVDKLPSLARKGGVLTPMTAFGNVLIERLQATGRFDFTSKVVGGAPEIRKDV